MRWETSWRLAPPVLCGAAVLVACALNAAPVTDRRGLARGPEVAGDPTRAEAAAADAGGLTAEIVLAVAAADAGAPPAPAAPDAAGSDVPTTVRPGRIRVPVLVYHHVVPDDEIVQYRGNQMVVSVSALDEQFRWLSEQGFHAVTPGELLAHYESNAPLPPRPVWITLDDGYASVYRHVFPALRRYGLRATVFVVTAWPGHPRYLKWDEVAELARGGLVQFESHSHDLHRTSGQRPVALGLPQEAVVSDLMESRRQIVRHTGRQPVAIAYPYGAHSPEVLAAARRAGFRLGVRADEQRHPVPGDPLLLLTRYGVFQWKRMPTFRAMLQP